MSAPDFQKVEEIFHAALECEPNQLNTFLSEKCAGDKILRREVEALLALHRQAGSFIETPVADVAAGLLKEDETDLLVGETIGHYKISKRISAGGMGAVYLADRADREYEKKVAIKLIKRGMDTDSVLRHFRSERQILANFDHTNIARLLDGGATESGLPYFVMEYVEGLPIDAYCDAHALSIVERLKLFRKVCAAVSYAHRHTVIHRDVKPSNILVTSDGTPKLLDFGIARILQPGVGTEPSVTLTGLRLMTPEYASPEQVRGQPVTTATDVYSLGVVLYQLLTGQKPYRLKTRTPEEISRAVLEQEPTRPSVVASASSRFPTGWKPGPQLRGDVDNIVLMALRKEPERRYKSVEQFSEDIRRHLEARPVRARKDTFGYRAAKFMRRNKTATAAAALVLLSLVGGIIATTLEAHRARVQEGLARGEKARAEAEKARAERRFNDVRRLAHSVLFDYHDAIKDLPGATRVRDRLVKDALVYLDSLAQDAGGDLALQRELAAAYERVGDVRGQAYNASLGDSAAAMDSYVKALRIREALVAANPRDAQSRRDLAESYRRIGWQLRDTSEASRGVELLQKAVALYAELTAQQPENTELREKLASNYNTLGLFFQDRVDWRSALDQYYRARTLREKLVADNPGEPKYRRGLAATYGNIGLALFISGDAAGALEIDHKALALKEALVASDPTNVDYRRILSISYTDDGDYRDDLGDKQGALECYRKSIAIYEELMAADPANAQTYQDVGYPYRRAGDLLAAVEEDSQALEQYRKALQVYESGSAKVPENLPMRLSLAICQAEVGRMQARRGEKTSALDQCRKAISLLGETAEEPTNAYHRDLKAQAYKYLGDAYAALAVSREIPATEKIQHWNAARDVFQRGLSIWEDMRSRGILIPSDASKPEKVAAEIAKCDAALQRPAK
jgi:non-specific serine/threonine protein kinase/serine/threonine-protein kinase